MWTGKNRPSREHIQGGIGRQHALEECESYSLQSRPLRHRSLRQHRRRCWKHYSLQIRPVPCESAHERADRKAKPIQQITPLDPLLCPFHFRDQNSTVVKSCAAEKQQRDAPLAVRFWLNANHAGQLFVALRMAIRERTCHIQVHVLTVGGSFGREIDAVAGDVCCGPNFFVKFAGIVVVRAQASPEHRFCAPRAPSFRAGSVSRRAVGSP